MCGRSCTRACFEVQLCWHALYLSSLKTACPTMVPVATSAWSRFAAVSFNPKGAMYSFPSWCSEKVFFSSWAGVARGARGAHSRCRFVLEPLIHFIPDSLTYSVHLFLKRQCDGTLGARRDGRGAPGSRGSARATRRCRLLQSPRRSDGVQPPRATDGRQRWAAGWRSANPMASAAPAGAALSPRCRWLQPECTAWPPRSSKNGSRDLGLGNFGGNATRRKAPWRCTVSAPNQA